jgi:RNA polymerase sigma-70 factor (ECF subfamily)
MTQPTISQAEAPLSDAQIVASVLEGHTDRFELLMRRYNARVFRSARAVLRNDAAAEDAAQNAWLLAFRKLSQWDASRGAFGTWVGAIALHEAIGQHRRAPRESSDGDAPEPEADDDDPSSPEARAFRTEARRIVEAAVDALPENLRTAFVLRDVEELSGAEAAALLGVTELTVRVRLFRARRALRDSMESLVHDGVNELFHFAGERCNRIVAAVFARLYDA